MSERYNLISIVDLSVEAQMKVLDVRNQLGVRKWMYSDHIIGKDEHIKWIERLKADDRQKVFVVMKNNTDPIGLASVNDIDKKHKKASWAFYLDEAFQGLGLGAVIEFNLINYCFDDLGLDKLNCEVIEGNVATLKLHGKFSFQNEGFLRENIIKNAKRIGVHLLGITQEEWHNKRAEIENKYSALLSKYNMVFPR
ncbi:MAG: UDP-4-amino-4,6-dideoxy-N-acetyl-beta-L-altrosamine N-acetyltransferase [Helicobacteraceae bacterium]|jgi:UDP-4-amino-4,6-dideoxy-N-acetyl-beta-L-altrosamine N-acetyltransferase|nr:UDP-4-amino-4,6-dideoxy-N-acetyl-beta-L-altrosamine N-acetyltransferase [Helicobacteraceae bacterium]